VSFSKPAETQLKHKGRYLALAGYLYDHTDCVITNAHIYPNSECYDIYLWDYTTYWKCL